MSMIELNRRSHFPNRSLYERLIVLSFSLAILKDVVDLPAFINDMGVVASLVDITIWSVFSLAIAFAVSRLKSRIAAVIFCALVALCLFVILTDFMNGRWANVSFWIGIMAFCLDCFAVYLIAHWFLRKKS